jgi:hypothetical protein
MSKVSIADDKSNGSVADIEQRARELLAAESERHGYYFSAESIRKGCDAGIRSAHALAAIAAALRAAPEWQPIETAPEGRLVVVGWLGEDGQMREEFDYIEDGMWIHHDDFVEHAQMVAPPGSKMPNEQPPYQWWIDLPALPSRPQEVKDSD